MRGFFMFFSFVILFFIFFHPIFAEQTVLTTIVDGVIYKHSYIDKPAKASVHIVEIDPKKCSIKSKAALDRCVSLFSTSGMAKEIGAIAAINGGYSDNIGIPAGILKIDNAWFSDQKGTRAAFGFDSEKKKFLIDIIETEILVKIGNSEFLVDRVNQKRKNMETILYLPTFGKPIIKNESNILNIVIQRGKVVGIITKFDRVEIPVDGFLLSISLFGEQCQKSSKIYVGDEASFFINVIPENIENKEMWNTLPNVVGGTPLLVKNQNIVKDFSKEKVLDSFLTIRYARTALGLKNDGKIIFIVVDNRGLENDHGLTIPQLAQLMFDVGCLDALSLSGGKSSTCYVNGKRVSCSLGDFSLGGIVNIEKPVSDILGVVK
jgi:exopolysaccharide biosynthesis protein